MDVTINKQCTNVELTSPVYFTKDTTSHVHLPQQVDSNHIMKANFVTGMDQNTFGGALLYHLQRKKNNESDNRPNTDDNASISTQLLVIWGRKSDGLYLHVYLIEHDIALVWNEDNLERLYQVYDSQYKERCTIIWEKDWLLDNNIMLKIERESSYEGDFEMKIVISEEEHLKFPIKPLWIDSNR
jgi:hypothetical protein